MIAAYRGTQVYGYRLRQARQYRGLSRHYLARVSMVPAHYIRSVERAEVTTVTEDARSWWCLHLGFSPAWFGSPSNDQIESGSSFVCNTDPYCGCGAMATLLCDAVVEEVRIQRAAHNVFWHPRAKVPERRLKTCDSGLCEDCTTRVKGKDYCEVHLIQCARKRPSHRRKAPPTAPSTTEAASPSPPAPPLAQDQS